MQFVSVGDNLHEMSMSILVEKNMKNTIKLSSAESALRVVKVNFFSLAENAKVYGVCAPASTIKVADDIPKLYYISL